MKRRARASGLRQQSPTHSPQLSPSVKQFALAVLLAVGTYCLYAPVLHNGFINYDDQVYVYDNPQVANGLSVDGLKWAFTTTEQNNWHPLTWMSHMFDVSVYGLRPGGHHFTSLLLHIANALLVLWVAFRLTGTFWPSYLLAALFAVHPMHIESVAWVAERKDVLSTLFFLLTILAYQVYVQRKQNWRMALVAALFAFGLMCKPMVVTLPFVLLLLDYWPLARFDTLPTPATQKDKNRSQIRSQNSLRNRRWPWFPPARLWLEKWPLFLLSGVFCLITLRVQSESMGVMDYISFADRCLNALTGYGWYLLKVVWPLHLSVFYPLARPAPLWPAILSGMVLVTITALVLAKRTERYLVAGWFFFLGTLVPVIGIVKVGSQAMADRYTYIPYLGLFAMVAFGGVVLRRRYSRVLNVSLPVLAGVALALLSLLTFQHVPRWKDSRTLFSYVIEHMPNNAEAWFHLADASMAAKDYSSAIAQFRQGLKFSPNDQKALNNLGTAYINSNDPSEALKCYETALRINPNYALAARNRDLLRRILNAPPPSAR